MLKSKHIIYDKHQTKYNQHKRDAIFVFVFMEECPYCIDMFSEWNNFKNKTSISTITVERNFLNDLKKKEPLIKNISPISYPHLELISNPSQNYIFHGPRRAEAFEKFYDLTKSKSRKTQSIDKVVTTKVISPVKSKKTKDFKKEKKEKSK